jgi:hypothetical protein
MFRHETVNGHQAVILSRAILKSLCKVATMSDFEIIGLPASTLAVIATQIFYITNTWQVVVGMRDGFRFHSTKVPPPAAATG